MLSLFPTFFSWQQAAPLVIRIVLGAIFIYWGYKGLTNKNHSAKEKTVAAIEGVAGILIFIGLWTQLAAIVIGIDLIIRLVGKIMKRQFLTDGVNYYLVLLILAFALLVSGAGWMAFDMPF